MTIEVTQHNIDDAHRYRDSRMQLCRSCPIVLAGKDAELIAPKVTNKDLIFETDEGERRCVALPPAALEMIERFDRGEHIEPMTFTVEVAA